MDMGKLVAKQTVVHFFGIEHLRQNFCKTADLLHELDPFGGGQVEQFRRVAFKDHHGPAWEELIVMEIGHRQAQIGDEVVGTGPDS